MRENLIQVAYLVASALFIIAIKLLNSPRTARLGKGQIQELDGNNKQR